MIRKFLRKFVHSLPYIRRLVGYINILKEELEILKKSENNISKEEQIKKEGLESELIEIDQKEKNDYSVYFKVK